MSHSSAATNPDGVAVEQAPRVRSGWCNSTPCTDAAARCTGLLVNGAAARWPAAVCPCACHQSGGHGVVVNDSDIPGRRDPAEIERILGHPVR